MHSQEREIILYGHIIEVTSDMFKAKLYEDSRGIGTFNISKFPISEIDIENRDEIVIGRVLRLRLLKDEEGVVYQYKWQFPKRKPLSPEEYDEIIEKANSLYNNIDWD